MIPASKNVIGVPLLHIQCVYNVLTGIYT